jgi:hypothetical protein
MTAIDFFSSIISKKGVIAWDGSDFSLDRLRTIFISLPESIKLPSGRRPDKVGEAFSSIQQIYTKAKVSRARMDGSQRSTA